MMDKESLKLTLSLIKKDEESGYKFSSKLFAIPWKIRIGRAKSKEKIPSISKFLQFTVRNYFDILTVTNRLAWQKDLWMNQKLPMGTWMVFAKLDVELFFMKIRSIFDYIAIILCRISDSKKIPQKRRKSFNKLRNWLIDPNEGKNNTKEWDKELANLVISVNWFDVMKDIRDSIFHEGGDTLVFPDKEKILFQVYKGYNNQISIPEIMYNENVVDFELFAGLYFGYLTAFLEDFAVNVEKKLPQSVRNIKCSPLTEYKKLPSIFGWTRKLL